MGHMGTLSYFCSSSVNLKLFPNKFLRSGNSVCGHCVNM